MSLNPLFSAWLGKPSEQLEDMLAASVPVRPNRNVLGWFLMRRCALEAYTRVRTFHGWRQGQWQTCGQEQRYIDDLVEEFRAQLVKGLERRRIELARKGGNLQQ